MGVATTIVAFLMMMNVAGVDNTPVVLTAYTSEEKCIKMAERLNNPPVPPARNNDFPDGMVAKGKFAFCVKPIFPV
jgi:hypothetical protein